MTGFKKALLPMAVLYATCSFSVEAATDAEKMNALQEQLNQQKAIMEQQQRMLESMNAELEKLKAGDSVTEVPMEAEIEVSPVGEVLNTYNC